MIPWQDILTQTEWQNELQEAGMASLRSVPDLKKFLDAAHIRYCLAKPYQELDNYPLVETRELLPSFDSDMFEYPDLPGFAMVAFGRSLDYFSEIFQFDKLHAVLSDHNGGSCPLEQHVLDQNLNTMATRLPKHMQPAFRQKFQGIDATLLDHYSTLLPYLLEMDRAHVLALDNDQLFHLAGIFASFPSDIDSEIKRFGMRIGKFSYGDSEKYERNRMFVYQYLMELYGFPIVSERRTSSALFARKLHKAGENFLLRVMGQSDRALTTYISDPKDRRYPRVEKIALVKVEDNQQEALDLIARKGFFLDAQKRVVIMRIRYRQHRFNASNLRQDRALSVASQEIIHPLTGATLGGLNIIKDTGNMFLRLNDIVRGEYNGRILYKRAEVIENTDSDEKRLKFLYSWLTKHQRRMIGYEDDFFDDVNRVINSYLKSPQRSESFENLRELYQEVTSRLNYIQQARRVRQLQDLAQHSHKGKKIGYHEMCHEAAQLLTQLQYELTDFFPELVDAVIRYAELILHDRYLIRSYVKPAEHDLTATGLEIRKNYGRLVALVDAIKAIRKARLAEKSGSEAVVA